MISKIVHFFGEAQYTRRRKQLLALILVVVVVADFLVPREHGHFFWDRIPGWSAFFGFLSCAAIIFVSKFLGHQGGLMKREDFYDD